MCSVRFERVARDFFNVFLRTSIKKRPFNLFFFPMKGSQPPDNNKLASLLVPFFFFFTLLCCPPDLTSLHRRIMRQPWSLVLLFFLFWFARKLCKKENIREIWLLIWLFSSFGRMVAAHAAQSSVSLNSANRDTDNSPGWLIFFPAGLILPLVSRRVAANGGKSHLFESYSTYTYPRVTYKEWTLRWGDRVAGNERVASIFHTIPPVRSLIIPASNQPAGHVILMFCLLSRVILSGLKRNYSSRPKLNFLTAKQPL